jgi:excisionase family DNA binding protein
VSDQDGPVSAEGDSERPDLPLPERLLLPEDVAGILGVSAKWVYAATQRGELPGIKVGRYVRFRRSAIEKWIDDRESTSEA